MAIAETAKSLSKSVARKSLRPPFAEWSDFSGIVDQRYLLHVESKFAGIPVAILTNGTSRLKRDLTRLGIENRFFKIFNSADIGICKPDIKIYQHVLKDLGCEPSRDFVC
ncbi:MAG: HAD-IA family hydrolase [Bdellovibrionales bacterium]|nr:HAD-IA family hydrolase [Bdellovibrionales bacterium]